MADASAKDAPSSPSSPPSPPSPPTAPSVAPAKVTTATDAPAKSASTTDIVLLGPPTADGAGVHVLRARDERIEAGELRAITEGRPITGEIVALSPRKDNPRICDVKESYAPPATHKGPAKVATSAYREGWDGIFGNNPTPDRDLN